MQRYVALLRGINVGGHRLKMTDLQRIFEELGFASVTTFIASGNVIFEAADADEPRLQGRIERQLKEALGYEVATFLRTPEEVAAIAAYEPFPPEAYKVERHTLSVLFMAAPAPGLHEQLAAFRTSYDDFHVHGREIYWLCQGRMSDSLVDWRLLEKTVRPPLSTNRNITTVRKLAAKCGV